MRRPVVDGQGILMREVGVKDATGKAWYPARAGRSCGRQKRFKERILVLNSEEVRKPRFSPLLNSTSNSAFLRREFFMTTGKNLPTLKLARTWSGHPDPHN
jgi:hypothetical protein